jgi:ribosomal-protein-alanine N-acetyltransferase
LGATFWKRNAQKAVIETERLVLRPLTIDDTHVFFELNNDPEVIQFTGDVPFASENDALDFLQNYDQFTKHKTGRMAVIRKDDNAFLGWCGIKFDPCSGEYDLGFRFFKKYWNQGFATEAAKVSLWYGFETLKISVILGRAMEQNVASIKVLEKCGMKYIGKKACTAHPGVIFQINKSDFK